MRLITRIHFWQTMWCSCHPCLNTIWKRIKKRGITLLACSVCKSLHIAIRVETSKRETHADIITGQREPPIKISRKHLPLHHSPTCVKIAKFLRTENKASSKHPKHVPLTLSPNNGFRVKDRKNRHFLLIRGKKNRLFFHNFQYNQKKQ